MRVLHHVAYERRQDSFDVGEKDKAEKFDACVFVAVRYSLRVLGLPAEFHCMAGKDPMYAKRFMPSLERRGDTAMADDVEKPLATRDLDRSSQMFKAVLTIKVSNVAKRA